MNVERYFDEIKNNYWLDYGYPAESINVPNENNFELAQLKSPIRVLNKIPNEKFNTNWWISSYYLYLFFSYKI